MENAIQKPGREAINLPIVDRLNFSGIVPAASPMALP
jgi:hypothetical protein